MVNSILYDLPFLIRRVVVWLLARLMCPMARWPGLTLPSGGIFRVFPASMWNEMASWITRSSGLSTDQISSFPCLQKLPFNHGNSFVILIQIHQKCLDYKMQLIRKFSRWPDYANFTLWPNYAYTFVSNVFKLSVNIRVKIKLNCIKH